MCARTLSTPTIAGVTKIAHRERVPNGALPKLGRVLTPLWERTTPSSKKRRLRWRCASLFHQLLCHHKNMLLPWVVLVWQTLYCKELLAKQDIIAHWYYWTRLLISPFADCMSFLCAWTHILFSSRAWSHLRCTPMELLPASQYVFVLGHIWNNDRHKGVRTQPTTSHHYSHSAWLSSLNNQVIVVRWLMIYLDLHFLVYDYHSLVAKYRHLCSWSHTVRGHILFGHDCWARCHEDTPCAWPYIIIAVDHATALQLIIHTCCSYVMWLDTLHWRDVLTWNIVTSLNDIINATVRKQCSSFVINFMEQDYWTRLLAKFIVIFYIWCCYSIVAYVHLRLRLQLQHLHPSIYNYIDYSSAVYLDALHCE